MTDVGGPAVKEVKVLLVDDDRDMLSVVGRTLSHAHGSRFTVTAVMTAEAALAAMDKQRFDLVISDQFMPGMSGTDLLVRARGHNASTGRILMTSASSLGVVKEAINRAAVHRYLEKPFERDEFLGAVRDVLEMRWAAVTGEAGPCADVEEAVARVREFQSQIKGGGAMLGHNMLMLELGNVNEFNQFARELRKMKNARISATHVSEGKYVVTMEIFPPTFESIR